MPLIHIPCAPGAHIGELLARTFLERELAPSQGFLLTNYHHPDGNGTEEHDLVLINERGVWAIEVKHWLGRIDADEVYWLHAGYRHPSPVISVERKARSLASTLREAGVNNISVVGMVVLTRHEAKFGIEPPPDHRRKVFRLTKPLIDAVTGSSYLYRPHNQRLKAPQMQHIQQILVERKVDPGRQVIGSYRLLRELEPGEGFRAYEAQHIRFDALRARVKQYHVTGFRSKAELDTAVRRFEQDMQALILLESPCIVREIDLIADPDSDDTHWLLLEWIEGQTLRDRLDDDSPIPLDEQRRILVCLATALHDCHMRGIIHRNVTPASIFLADNGSIKLGNFDFARVPGVGKAFLASGVPLTINKYAAPELQANFHSADARADLYALGAIWYDMALHRPPDEPLQPSLIDQASLPASARKLLHRLLAPTPTERPRQARDILPALEALG